MDTVDTVDTEADVSVFMATAHGVRGRLETVAAARRRSAVSAVGGAIRRDSVRGN